MSFFTSPWGSIFVSGAWISRPPSPSWPRCAQSVWRHVVCRAICSGHRRNMSPRADRLDRARIGRWTIRPGNGHVCSPGQHLIPASGSPVPTSGLGSALLDRGILCIDQDRANRSRALVAAVGTGAVWDCSQNSASASSLLALSSECCSPGNAARWRAVGLIWRYTRACGGQCQCHRPGPARFSGGNAHARTPERSIAARKRFGVPHWSIADARPGDSPGHCRIASPTCFSRNAHTSNSGLGMRHLLPAAACLARKGLYYLGPIYPTLFAAGAAALGAISGVLGQVLRLILILLITTWGAISLPFGLPIVPPRPMAKYAAALGIQAAVTTNRGTTLALPQDYADMLGWEEQVYAGSAA